MASSAGSQISPSDRQIMSQTYGWAHGWDSHRKALPEHYYSSARSCKHTSQRAVDASRIFITTVIDFMFGVNYACLLNLKPVAHYNSGSKAGVIMLARNGKNNMSASRHNARLRLHLRNKQRMHVNTQTCIRQQIILRFHFYLPHAHHKHAHARTLTDATNKSPIFSVLSHSATRDASAIWNMEWHWVISLIR